MVNATLPQITAIESEDMIGFVTESRPREIRNMREWAEDDVLIPDGPHKGMPFSCRNQPVHGLILDSLIDKRFQYYALTGPVQSGKTTIGMIIPLMYYQCELRSNTLLGAPDDYIAANKWKVVLKPAYESSAYSGILPQKGPGSKGGSQLDTIYFENGTHMKLMTAGGGDSARSSYTSPFVVVTEADKMDEAGEASRESDPVTQMYARSNAYDDRAKCGMECTVSIEEGRIWQEITNGTNSRIMKLCPRCEAYVQPGREHLLGWQDAKNEIEAKANACIHCPDCGNAWTEQQRRWAVEHAVLIHEGEPDTEGVETIWYYDDEKRVVLATGIPKQTRTLGIRYDCVDNLFVSMGTVGAKEWNWARAINEDNAEKEACQFYWVVPYSPDIEASVPLTYQEVERAADRGLTKGIVPADTTHLSIGIDIGKWNCHWWLHAGRANGSEHLVDYGVIDVPTAHMEQSIATLSALSEFAETVVDVGWPLQGNTEQMVSPGVRIVDSGYMTAIIYQFIREQNARIGRRAWYPYKGYSALKRVGYDSVYWQPKAPTRGSGRPIKYGDNYHVQWHNEPMARVWLVHVDSDAWKTDLQKRFGVAKGTPGSLTLWGSSQPNEHKSIAQSLISEREDVGFVPGKGNVKKWVVVHRKKNHYLDAGSMSRVGLHLGGFRIAHQGTPPPSTPNKPKQKSIDILGGDNPYQ